MFSHYGKSAIEVEHDKRNSRDSNQICSTIKTESSLHIVKLRTSTKSAICKMSCSGFVAVVTVGLTEWVFRPFGPTRSLQILQQIYWLHSPKKNIFSVLLDIFDIGK